MNKVIKNLFGLFLVAVVAIMPLQGMENKVGQGVEASAANVAQEISLLDQILELAGRVLEAEDNKSRSVAKKELAHLIGSKELSIKIKELIKDDVAIIQKTTNKTIEASQEAYNHLLDVIASINAQANVIVITQQATRMVQNAPEGEKLAVMQLAYQKIQKATKAAQNIAISVYSGAKGMVTRPVNYVFGKEDSTAKTAFYATVGVLVLASGAYGSYRYGVDATDKRLSSPIRFLTQELDSEVQKNLTFLESVLAGYKEYFSTVSDEKERFEQQLYLVRYPAEENIFMAKYMKVLKDYRETRDLIKKFEDMIANKKTWREASVKKFRNFFAK